MAGPPGSPGRSGPLGPVGPLRDAAVDAALDATPSQTIGPFFSVALSSPAPARLAAPDDTDSVRLEGQVLDGDGDGVGDALVEVWDAAAQRFARCHTGGSGHFAFIVRHPSTTPFLDVTVFARGLLGRLVTRCYFADVCPDDGGVLAAVPDERRPTLVADERNDFWRFDIHLQGDSETVFFAL